MSVATTEELRMPVYTVIDAPSNLGLRPSGVEALPIALKAAGLISQLGATYGGRVAPLPYHVGRDPQTLVRNGEAIAVYSSHLADVIAPVVQGNTFPVLLGGDCSVLIGALLGLRRVGRYGLFFLDGHADFYQPQAELHGEVASMDLAIVTGHGPDQLANLDGLRRYMCEHDAVAFGFRDAEQAVREGSQDIRHTAIQAYELTQARQPDVKTAAAGALAALMRDELAGFWIHLDLDVLNDDVMPAVDYRMPGGLTFDELSDVLRILVASGKAV
jgi:arginase